MSKEMFVAALLLLFLVAACSQLPSSSPSSNLGMITVGVHEVKTFNVRNQPVVVKEGTPRLIDSTRPITKGNAVLYLSYDTFIPWESLYKLDGGSDVPSRPKTEWDLEQERVAAIQFEGVIAKAITLSGSFFETLWLVVSLLSIGIFLLWIFRWRKEDQVARWWRDQTRAFYRSFVCAQRKMRQAEAEKIARMVAETNKQTGHKRPPRSTKIVLFDQSRVRK